MLFDLRGRGRRRAVQGIYLALALLMGGGLVLFGVGGNTSGGLFDAFSSDKNSGADTTYTKKIDATQKQIDAHPTVAAAYAKMASLRLAQGSAEGAFDNGNAKAQTQLRLASAAWTKYVSLNPEKLDLSVARQMINVYGTTGLNEPVKAVGVMDLVVDASPATADLYKQYAVLAIAAGQTRKGDLAINKAVALSPPSDRKTVRSGLEQYKAQAAAAAQQAAQQAAGGAATATSQSAPTTTATPAPTTTSKSSSTAKKPSTTKKKSTSASKKKTAKSK